MGARRRGAAFRLSARIKLGVLLAFAGCAGALGLELVALGAGEPAPQARTPAGQYQVQLPLGIPRELWEAMVPPDNPMTPEKVKLGEKLFFDKRLSLDRTVSCATCHDPAAAFASEDPVALGVALKAGARNSPTVLNAMFNETQFWDGRATTLEEQMKLPLINPLEMAIQDHKAVIGRVREIPEYQRMFEQVFGDEGITIDTIAKAVAAFERTQVSGNSPFDRFMAGDQKALSASARRGWDLFNGQARCITCHAFNASQPFFTDNKFHNIGVAAKNRNFEPLVRRVQQAIRTGGNSQERIDQLALTEGFSELGRFIVTQQPKDIGAFKTSGLRDIELTAPYMHNGSEKTLLDVVKFYDKGGEINPNLDGGMRPLKLTDAQMADLVEFMKALTGDDVRAGLKKVKRQTRDPFSEAGR